MLILDLWGISFHAVVVFGLGKNLLFKSILGLCELYITIHSKTTNQLLLKTHISLEKLLKQTTPQKIVGKKLKVYLFFPFQGEHF